MIKLKDVRVLCLGKQGACKTTTNAANTVTKYLVPYRGMQPTAVNENISMIDNTLMNNDIQTYNNKQSAEECEICNLLAEQIMLGLPEAENKIWHAHPVWFLDGNPIVGYSKLKGGIRLMFWSGQSFDEEGLHKEGSFKAAEKRYTSVDEVNAKDLKRWLKMSSEIQWDYKNIVKRKGMLERLK